MKNVTHVVSSFLCSPINLRLINLPDFILRGANQSRSESHLCIEQYFRCFCNQDSGSSVIDCFCFVKIMQVFILIIIKTVVGWRACRRPSVINKDVDFYLLEVASPFKSIINI